MLRAFDVPLPWSAIARRTAREVIVDDCMGLAAQLGYYFLLALFPALLFVVALVSFVPIEGVLDTVTGALGRFLPHEALALIQDQILKIADNKDGGLLTLGLLGAIWSTSAGVSAIIGTLNKAYDIDEARPWWEVKLISLGLTFALAVVVVASAALIMIGPTIARWPAAFGLVTFGIAMIYYYAPDAEQEWTWITPGSIFATCLWLAISLAFKFYVAHFGSYNATYGAIGGVIILMLWLYGTALAVLVGAELNAEIEHASPYGKAPGEKQAGVKKKIGMLARRHYEAQQKQAAAVPARHVVSPVGAADPRPAPMRPRASDWILSALVVGQAGLLIYSKLRSRFRRLKIGT